MRGAYPDPKERTVLISEDWGRQGGMEMKQTLLSSPSLSHLAHILLSYHIFPWHTSSSLALEYWGLTASSHLHFLRKTPTWHSTWICIFFFLVISFVTDPQQEPRRVEEIFFPSLWLLEYPFSCNSENCKLLKYLYFLHFAIFQLETCGALRKCSVFSLYTVFYQFSLWKL